MSRLDKRENKTPVFPSLYATNKRKLNDKYFKPRKHLQSILKSHGLKHGTLHSFRTTFNNALRDLGLGIDDRAILLTHSSSETTKIYTHPNIEKALEYVNSLPIFNTPKIWDHNGTKENTLEENKIH
jgi:integrase